MEALLAHPAYQSARTIATYLPLTFEMDNSLLIETALRQGKRLLVPKVIGKGEMIFVAYEGADLVPSAFGVLEPRSSLAVAKNEIDLIHVPGVAFNAEGYRIGFGGGYYDRYLDGFQGDTISTIYAIQRREFIPDAHDIAVREVLSDVSIR